MRMRKVVWEVLAKNLPHGPLPWLCAWLKTQNTPLTIFAQRLGSPARHYTAMSERQKRHQDPLILPITRKFGSSALLVMKSHQQKAWKTFTRFGRDFLRWDQGSADQQESPLRRCPSLAGLQEAKKEPKGSAQKSSPEQMKRVRPRQSLKTM